MKTSKIIAFIAFIINGLFLAFVLSSFLNGRSINSISSEAIFRFLILPIILAIGSLLYWLYLRNKERKGELVKFSLLVSIALLFIPPLNFIILLISSIGGSFMDLLALFQLGIFHFYTFGLPIILLIILASLILIFLPTKFYKNFFIQILSFLTTGIMFLLFLANLILFFLGIYGFLFLSKCEEQGICGMWAIGSFVAGGIGIVVSGLLSFLLITKNRKTFKEEQKASPEIPKDN